MNGRGLAILLLASAAACSGSSNPTPTDPIGNTPEPAAGKVSVALASVTLAEDCGTAPTTAPAEPTTAAASATQDVPSGAVSSQRVAAGSMAKRACQQSSVQLVVSNTTAASASMKVKSVTVLDSTGATVVQLNSYEPSRWAADTYQPWDGSIEAGATLNVAYSLSEPAVNAGETYTVRVVVETAGGDTTVETQASAEVYGPASLPPGAVT